MLHMADSKMSVNRNCISRSDLIMIHNNPFRGGKFGLNIDPFNRISIEQTEQQCSATIPLQNSFTRQTNFTSVAFYPDPPFHGHSCSKGTVLIIRSEEHTSELQSRGHLVCRLLLEKKKKPTAVANP